MTYSIKEIFYTIQGEGRHAGRPAVFCRFTGCNLWTGREQHRHKAICQFCDTEFVGTDGPGGGKFKTSEELATAIRNVWDQGVRRETKAFVVCTGGEPLLQLDEDLVRALHDLQFEIAVETNGTRPAPPDLDWICVSPKAGAPLAQTTGNELKLVYPQEGALPEQFESLDFEHFYLQPMDGPNVHAHTASVIDFCKQNPNWKVSVQTHKLLGIP